MTIEELFAAQGIEGDQAKALMKAMRDNKIFTASEENMDVRYSKLKDEHAGKLAELEKANGLIAELQKSNKGNEKLQEQVSQYEAEIAELQSQLAQTQLDAAIKVALLGAHALDVDYLTFKLKESGDLELAEDGTIKGWDDRLAGLKTKFPTQFESAGQERRIEENRLDKDTEGKGGMTRAEILKMPYAERAKLFAENKDVYEEAMKKG